MAEESRPGWNPTPGGFPGRCGNDEKARKRNAFGLFLAGDERIELPLRVLETPVMPFDQSPVSNVLYIYTTGSRRMSSIFLKIVRIYHECKT